MTTKTKQQKKDLFAILTINLDVENKTEDQFRRKLRQAMKDRKTIDAIEAYVSRKLKPFGLDASRTWIDDRSINEA